MTTQQNLPGVDVPYVSSRRLLEIEERADAANPGPWKVDVAHNAGDNWLIADFGHSDQERADIILTTDGVHASEFCGSPEDDAVFCAQARQDIPDMVAEIRRLRAENLGLKNSLAALRFRRPLAVHERQASRTHLG